MCYRNDGEKLVRVAESEDQCGPHETFVQLSPGATGPQGEQGVPGPSTGGAVFYDSSEGTTQLVLNQFLTVAEIPQVAPGAYVITGRAQARNVSTRQGFRASCSVGIEDLGELDRADFFQSSTSMTPSGDVFDVPLTMSGVVVRNDTSSVVLSCTGNAAVSRIKLIVMRVGDVTNLS